MYKYFLLKIISNFIYKFILILNLNIIQKTY